VRETDFSTSLKGFKRGEGEASSLFNKVEYVFGACAGAALFRRKMIDEIGFLDEDFFLIHEDTDFNFRAQLYGWKVLYVPAAVVQHKVRSSIGHMSDTEVYYSLRNSALVRIKNVPLALFISCFPEFIMGLITEFINFAINRNQLKLYFKAKIDVIRMLRVMLKKRKINLQGAKVNTESLRELMTPIFERNYLRKRLKKLFFG
jgi:GT2 family glycosyltransferase